MRAAVFHGRRDVRVEERPTPRPGAGSVLLRVSRCGICGTDAAEFQHGPRMFPVEQSHPASGHHGPMIMGHEFVGEVVGVGEDVSREWLGRRLASGAGVSCGRCRWCRAGRTNLCARYWTLGLSADGGLAEYVAVPLATCAEIPTRCGDDAAALAQPLAVAVHALARGQVRPDDDVVLIGAGAIGSFILAALADARPRSITVLDVDDGRLATASALGADNTVDARAELATEAVLDITGGGANVVIEASGAPGGAQRALRLAARGGRVVLVGLPHEPQRLDLADATLREVDLRTTVAHVYDSDIPAALRLLASTDLVSHLLDRVIPIEDVVGDGLDAMLAGAARGKILVAPGG